MTLMEEGASAKAQGRVCDVTQLAAFSARLGAATKKAAAIESWRRERFIRGTSRMFGASLLDAIN